MQAARQLADSGFMKFGITKIINHLKIAGYEQ